MGIRLMERDRKIMQYIEQFKGVTISQCAKIFYKNSKFEYGLYSARLRLKKLYDNKYINRYKDINTKKIIYNFDKKISTHDIYLMDVYAEIINMGGHILHFKHEPSFDTAKGKRRGDGLFEFVVGDIEKAKQNKKSLPWYSLLVEVDKEHQTDIRKMHYIFNTHKLQEKYKKYQNNDKEIFPHVLIVKSYVPINPYYTDDFKITYLDYSLKGFSTSILS